MGGQKREETDGNREGDGYKRMRGGRAGKWLQSNSHKIIPLTSRAAAIIKLSTALAAQLSLCRSTIKIANYD